MSHETPVLSARKRERLGSRYARRVRDAGNLPAVVYGHKQDPVSISMDAKETLGHIYKGVKLFSLDIEGEEQIVLLKDLQYDYLGTNIMHMDFARVDLTERVNVRVPLHLIGDAEGLKTSGALLISGIAEIELECLVTNLPEFIEVDISGLDVGDPMTAGKVQLPLDTMVLLTDPETLVANIVIQAAEETDEEAQVAGAEGSEPEVLTQKKDEADSE